MHNCEGCGAIVSGDICLYCGIVEKEESDTPRQWTDRGVLEMIDEGLDPVPNSFISSDEWLAMQGRFMSISLSMPKDEKIKKKWYNFL